MIKKGGQEIQKELNAARKRNPREKVIVTTGGKLPCKHIIHLNLSHDTDAGKHIVTESFHQIVSMNARTIAISVFSKF